MSKKKLVFEEVGPLQKVSSKTLSIDDDKKSNNRLSFLSFWLFTLFFLVALQIVIGGLTRLTDSGLSIVEWKPIVGAIPPLTEEKWAVEFEKYKGTYEFLVVNHSMSINEFKTIYWWEWGHRQLGRFIGLIWFFGFLTLLLRRQIPPLWTSKLVSLGVLGALQGAIGWWMVSSGLQGQSIDVASYRLAIHLTLAFSIIGLICWYILLSDKSTQDLMLARRSQESKLVRLCNIFLGLLFLQIILGALVAGIGAGQSYNDWPLMGGEVFPSDYLEYTPLYLNLLDNPASVQFNHRIVGYFSFLLAIFIWFKSRKSPLKTVKRKTDIMVMAVFLQIFLGILTVLYSATLQLAILHQLMALILFITVIRARFEVTYPTKQVLV